MSVDNLQNICHGEKFVLLLKNPETVFALWSFNETKNREFESGNYAGKIEICLYTLSEQVALGAEECQWNKNRLYVKAPAKGKEVFAVIYAHLKSGEKVRIMESNPVYIPDIFPEKVEFTYGSEFFKKGALQ